MRAAMIRLIPRPVILALIACGLLAAAPLPAASQTTGDIAVVVNADVPIDNLSLADLRHILLGDREFWPSGARVTLLIRAPIARERDAAVKDVCQMTEAQFRQHWIGKVFRADAASGPKIVYTAEMAMDQASRLAGAITFVQAPVTTKGLKVVKIDGKAPGQAGYKLK